MTKKENTYVDDLEEERFNGMDFQDRNLIERCESLAPITLSTIKRMGRSNLIQIILTREIAYNDLLKQLNLGNKLKRVQNFVENEKNPFSWFESQIEKSNKIIYRLEREKNHLLEVIQKYRDFDNPKQKFNTPNGIKTVEEMLGWD